MESHGGLFMLQALGSRALSPVLLALTFPFTALADLNQTTTLQTNQTLNLDTGATASSGGDLLWDGTRLAPQGTATAYRFPTAIGSISTFTKAVLDAFRSFATSNPVSVNVNDVVIVFTNAGSSSGVLVKSKSGGSITVQFVTYVTVVPIGPTITQIQNNSSSIPSGFPNYGIAPSSLFKIVGTGLAASGDATLHSSEGAGLQITLNGASVTVTVGATVVHPALYYATPTQIDAVLPANTPVGAAKLTVTYNNAVSAAANFVVVASAVGLTDYNGNYGVATDLSGNLLTMTNSGKPGQAIIVWATGLGADPADSDTTYTNSPHAINTQVQIYFGGVLTTAIYQGASTYPGVDVIILTIPNSVPSGCWIPMAVVTTNGTNVVVSNIVTFSINPSGGACVDVPSGLNGSQLTPQSSQSLKTGLLALIQTNSAKDGTVNVTDAAFQKYTGIFSPNGQVSPGGCVVNFLPSTGGTIEGLKAGVITLTGPNGLDVTLANQFGIIGAYYSPLAAGAIPSTGGTFIFKGSGGADVGSFTSTVTLTNPLMTWTNQASFSSVDRTQPLTVTWSGGNPGSYVFIAGGSVATGNPAVKADFTCMAPVEAGQFTVPSYILLSLPAGNGSLNLQNAVFAPLTATGIDVGTVDADIDYDAPVTFH